MDRNGIKHTQHDVLENSGTTFDFCIFHLSIVVANSLRKENFVALVFFEKINRDPAKLPLKITAPL